MKYRECPRIDDLWRGNEGRKEHGARFDVVYVEKTVEGGRGR